MGRIINRHRERTASPPPKDWKDSRLVIAALSAAGTATFMGTVVVPLTTTALTAKLDALAPAAERIEKLEKELARTKAALATARTEAALATVKNPFLPGSVYPVGLDTLRIGDSRKKVEEKYPRGKWAEDESYYSVTDIDHAVFSRVTYYFDGDQNNQIVSMILYHFHYDSPWVGDALRTRFTVLFGSPSITGTSGRAWWSPTARESIEIDSSNSYTVYSTSRVPRWVLKFVEEQKLR